MFRQLFTIPEREAQLLTQLANGLWNAGFLCNKNEVVRAGLHALAQLSCEKQGRIFDGLERLRPGPEKGTVKK